MKRYFSKATLKAALKKRGIERIPYQIRKYYHHKDKPYFPYFVCDSKSEVDELKALGFVAALNWKIEYPRN